mgnify:CR=1 FL=1
MNTLSHIKYNLFAAIKNQKKNQPNKYTKKNMRREIHSDEIKNGGTVLTLIHDTIVN